MKDTTTIKQFEQLPPHLQKEVSDFIGYLFSKYQLQTPPQTQRKSGTMKSLVTFMADDFDAPLDDFNDYQQ